MGNRVKQKSGMTLVEVIIVSALVTIVFGGLFVSFQYTMDLINNSKAKLSALSIANDQIEYFRSLPYNDVGTVAGIPPGVIPQNSTTTLNGIIFTKRVLVEYVDDPADGAGVLDGNSIPNDYKRIKITVSWSYKENTNEISLISNIVPRSIETSVGGGTIRVNVIDSNSNFLPGAQVTLRNDTTTSTINITRATDSNGIALFSGAPAGSNYQVFVTAPGFSQDQTYVATTSNPNPAVAPFSLLEADVSTVTFQIDALSDLTLTTYSSITDVEDKEEFSDSAGIATSTNTVVSSGQLQLQDTAGVFAPSGISYLATLTPGTLEQWEAITVAATTPTATSYRVQLFTASSSSYELIPDSDLPGNSVGFIGPIISIAELDSGSYPAIVLGLTLETTNTTATPYIDEIAIYYRSAEARRSNTSLPVRGTKTIGTTLAALPIYKFSSTLLTDGTGEGTISNLEFDTYIVESPTLTIARACPDVPINHVAGIDSDVELVLVSAGSHTLRALVEDSSGMPIPGATVTVTRPSFFATGFTNACGQTFFSTAIASSTDYDISVTKSGFTAQTINSFTISGDTSTQIILNEI